MVVVAPYVLVAMAVSNAYVFATLRVAESLVATLLSLGQHDSANAV